MIKNREEIVVLVLDEDKESTAYLINSLNKCDLHLSNITCSSFKEAEIIFRIKRPAVLFCSLDTYRNQEKDISKKIKSIGKFFTLVTYTFDVNASDQPVPQISNSQDHLNATEITARVLTRIIKFSLENFNVKDQLREAQDRFALLARATNNIAWDWELSRKSALWIGNGLTSFLKFPKKEMRVDANFWEKHLHPEDKKRVLINLNNILDGALKPHWEDSYRLKNMEGEYRHIYDRGFIIYKNKKPVRMVGMMEDITAKILMEEKLATEKLIQQKQISEAVVTAQEKERSEIGKELHDNVNQLLGASRLYIDAAGKDQDNTAFLLSQASGFIKNAIDEIRVLSKVLHTPLISEIGLLESIENLGEEIMIVNKITININAEEYEEDNLNYNFKLTIYRIIQEQLSNILKHSQAEKVTITVMHNENEFTLSIEDDGVGFDVQKKREGIGISNIASRTKMYSGNIGIESSPGNGTMLWVQFPVSDLINIENLEMEKAFPAK